ncbi:MAG TPA: DNA-binding protein [bacterium]|nr:DNA-binding protein [bacterium]
MSIRSDLKDAAYKTSGSKATRAAKISSANRFADWLQKNNLQIRSLDKLKAKYIERYAQESLSNLAIRTAQNHMSNLRTCLREAGRHQLADLEKLSNKNLGLAGSSRDGTHRAIKNDEYQQAKERAFANGRPEIASVMDLQRSLGLRAQEAIQGSCRDTLDRWEKELKNGKILVNAGTKGGRPRETWIAEGQKNQALEAIKEAKKILGEKTNLIEKPNLKAAINFYHRHARNAGLKGEISSHSMRYAWANDAVKFAKQEREMSEREALAFVSQSLGHGDGRGRYVAQVYLK